MAHSPEQTIMDRAFDEAIRFHDEKHPEERPLRTDLNLEETAQIFRAVESIKQAQLEFHLAMLEDLLRIKQNLDSVTIFTLIRETLSDLFSSVKNRIRS